MLRFPGLLQMYEDSRADLTMTTVHYDVGIAQEAPKTGDSVMKIAVYIPSAK